MNLQNCYNFNDFRKLAKKKLPSPIFHYIDGGADDEITLQRNTKAFEDCDLVPNILASVGKPDLSTTIFGKKIDILCVKGSGWDLGTIEAAGLPAVKLEPLLKLRQLSKLSDEDMVNVPVSYTHLTLPTKA